MTSVKGLGAMLGGAPCQGVVRRVDVGTQYIRVSQLLTLIYPSTDGDRERRSRGGTASRFLIGPWRLPTEHVGIAPCDCPSHTTARER